MQPSVQFSIIRSNRKTICMKVVSADQVEVRAPLGISTQEIQAFIQKNEKWLEKHIARMREARAEMGEMQPFTPQEINALAQQAVKVLPGRLQYYAPLVGVDYGRVTVRCQRTKWGSCTSQGNLNFNCLLMLCPPEVLDYIVVHELCHRKELNHSPRFWAEVERVMPDYKQHRDWLKQNGNRLIERIPK